MKDIDLKRTSCFTFSNRFAAHLFRHNANNPLIIGNKFIEVFAPLKVNNVLISTPWNGTSSKAPCV